MLIALRSMTSPTANPASTSTNAGVQSAVGVSPEPRTYATTTKSVMETSRSRKASPIMLSGRAPLGNGKRETIGRAPTMLGIPFVRQLAKKLHSASPDIVNTA
jgi:hypothetical protein